MKKQENENENEAGNQDARQIAHVDEKLAILRESWMDSNPEKKSTWMAKLDAALDERSKLMKIRDGMEPITLEFLPANVEVKRGDSNA